MVALKRRILVIDDDPAIIAGFGLFFSDKRCEVRSANTAEAGIKAVEKERFDVIFLDNGLPVMTGLQALPILGRKSAAPILMMTAHFDPELKKDALLLGAYDCMAKPIPFDDLAARLEKLLGA